MCFFLISFLFYRQGYKVYGNVGMALLPFRFGFQAGGNFTVNVTKAGTKSILYLLATYDDVKTYYNSITHYNYCNGTKSIDYVNIIDLSTGNGTASGVITKSGMYYTAVSSCTLFDNGYTFYFQYINPTSYLSTDEQPCLITVPFICFATSILFIVWLINWFCNFSFKNSLHFYLTIGILLTVVYQYLYLFEYIMRNASDEFSPVFTARKVFRVLQETMLLSAMLMASDGWCIIHDKLPIWHMILAFVLSAGITIPYAISDFAYLTTMVDLAVLLTALVVAGIYLFIMLHNINIANQIVQAHLFVIAESGIDPKTTPIYKKHRIFTTLSYSIIIYFMVLIFRTAFNSLWTLPIYVMHLIYDLIIVILICIIAWIFRMKKETTSGYMMIGDNGEEPRTFDREDIQSFDFDSVNNERIPYEEGMTLPAQPVVTRNKKDKKGKKDKTDNKDVEEQERNEALLPEENL